jgi:ubiquinone/menaquinone biosynthesis C-methylase UbiE
MITNRENQEVSDLHKVIDDIDKIGDENWKTSLNERKKKELEFHDRDRDLNHIDVDGDGVGDIDALQDTVSGDTFEKFYGNRKYYSINARSVSYANEWIKREASGNIFLDFACGNGNNSRVAAESGALLSLGFDISSVSIKNARRLAKEEGLTNTRYFQADAEDTKLPDSCIDRIVCSGMLHHLDLSYALPELRRILKPGGKILAIEALDYNPLIKLYRMLTPDMRTEWEKAHILDLKDVEFAKRFFNVENIKYWHVTGYAAGKFPVLFKPLDFADRILENIPYVQRLSCMFTFELVKNDK